jgi:hypothetical protein
MDDKKIYKVEIRKIHKDEIEFYEKHKEFTSWRDLYLHWEYNPTIEINSDDFEDWKPYSINNIEYYESKEDAEWAVESFRYDENWYPADYQVIEEWI